jgi:hypothetical protein
MGPAVTAWPDSAQKWRDTTALFGPADWDTGVLHGAVVADAHPASPHAADAAAALAGDSDAAGRLGVAGIVALRSSAGMFEVQEDVDGWGLVASAGTPDVPGLAMAAVIRAARLYAERRALREDPR